MGAKLWKQKKDESESDTDTSINSGATIVRTKDRNKICKTKKSMSCKPKDSKIKTGKTKTGKTKTGKLNASKLKSGSKDKKAKDDAKDEGKRKSKKSRKKKVKVNYIIKLVDWVKVNYPVAYKLLIKSNPNELWPLKRLLAFPVGLLISLAFYTMIVRRLQDSSNEYQQSLKLVMITFVSITYTFSTQMKVISWLIVPTFLGIIKLIPNPNLKTPNFCEFIFSIDQNLCLRLTASQH